MPADPRRHGSQLRPVWNQHHHRLALRGPVSNLDCARQSNTKCRNQADTSPLGREDELEHQDVGRGPAWPWYLVSDSRARCRGAADR